MALGSNAVVVVAGVVRTVFDRCGVILNVLVNKGRSLATEDRIYNGIVINPVHVRPSSPTFDAVKFFVFLAGCKKDCKGGENDGC